MFCPNCGKALEESQRFCPNCGTPAPEVPVEPVPPEAPTAPEPQGVTNPFSDPAPAAPTPPPPAPPSPPDGGEVPPSGGAPANSITIDQGTMVLVLRIASAVLAVLFGLSALKRVPVLFGNIFGYFNIPGILTTLVLLAAAVVMCGVLVLTALKWRAEFSDLVFVGACLATIIRLLGLVVAVVLNLLFHHYFIGFRSLPYVLGYAVVAGILFLIMYLMGCPPILGKDMEGISASVSAGFGSIAASAEKAKNEYQAKAAQNKAAPSGAAPGPDLSYAKAGDQKPPVYTVRAKKTNRGLLGYILLSIITCGIYPFIFIYSLSSDMNDICEGDGSKTGGLVAFILLGFITCGIYQIIWWYKLCNRMAANAPRYGLAFQENGTTFLLWTLFGALLCGLGPFIALHFVIRNANALCAAYNQYNGLYGAPN